MRKRRVVFFDSLLTLLFCWGVSSYLNPSDQDSVLLLASCLLLLCTLILIPVALSSLRTDSWIKGGFLLLAIMLPVIAALSYPGVSLLNFDLLLAKVSYFSDIKPWVINLAVHSFLFFLAGSIFASLNKGQQSSWKGAALTSFMLASVYALSFYYLYLQSPGILGSI